MVYEDMPERRLSLRHAPFLRATMPPLPLLPRHYAISEDGLTPALPSAHMSGAAAATRHAFFLTRMSLRVPQTALLSRLPLNQAYAHRNTDAHYRQRIILRLRQLSEPIAHNARMPFIRPLRHSGLIHTMQILLRVGACLLFAAIIFSSSALRLPAFSTGTTPG